jgi:hypothetical protein
MYEGIVPLLSLLTLLAVAVLALISKERTKDRMRDPNAPVSTLAKDGKYGGVAFLRPLAERIRDPRDPVLRQPVVAERVWDEPVIRTRY